MSSHFYLKYPVKYINLRVIVIKALEILIDYYIIPCRANYKCAIKLGVKPYLCYFSFLFEGFWVIVTERLKFI